MERIAKEWGADILGGIVTCLCWFSDFFHWFTPENCDHLAKIIAVIVGIITLFFITLPKAWPNIRRMWK